MVNQKCAIISRHSYLFSSKFRETLFKSLVLSHFDYCSTLFTYFFLSLKLPTIAGPKPLPGICYQDSNSQPFSNESRSGAIKTNKTIAAIINFYSDFNCYLNFRFTLKVIVTFLGY